MGAKDINLLQSKTTLSEEQEMFLSQLRAISYGVMSVALVLGISVGMASLLLSQQLSSVEATKTQVLRSISQQARKEVLYASLKNRLPMIQKALESQKSWKPVLNEIFALASPPVLASVQATENGVLDFQIKAGTLEETAGIVAGVIRLYEEGKVKNPQLAGLQIADDGTVMVRLSVLPVFSAKQYE